MKHPDGLQYETDFVGWFAVFVPQLLMIKAFCALLPVGLLLSSGHFRLQWTYRPGRSHNPLSAAAARRVFIGWFATAEAVALGIAGGALTVVHLHTIPTMRPL